MHNITDLIGWLGAIILLVGFWINIFKKISNNSLIYLIINFIGSLLLIINAYINDAYPFILVNTFWMIFSLYKILTKNNLRESD